MGLTSVNDHLAHHEIGLLCCCQTGRFIWLDGSHWSYADWLSEEPNSTSDVEDCVEVLALGKNQTGVAEREGHKYCYVTPKMDINQCVCDFLICWLFQEMESSTTSHARSIRRSSAPTLNQLLLGLEKQMLRQRGKDLKRKQFIECSWKIGTSKHVLHHIQVFKRISCKYKNMLFAVIISFMKEETSFQCVLRMQVCSSFFISLLSTKKWFGFIKKANIIILYIILIH